MALLTPVRVLYIGGTGRTGSTLLEKMLAQLDGVFAAGELTWLWYGLRGHGRCSCGEPLRVCPVWSAVFTEAYGGVDEIDPEEMMALRHRFRSVHLPLMVTGRLHDRYLRRLGPYPERLERLYRAIQTVTGAGVIVDASKEPHYSSILRTRPGLDVRFLHLVRDPRAVAHSWARTRTERGFGEGHFMERRGAVKSAVYYDVSNVASEALWKNRGGRYRRLRYEDFVADPVAAIAGAGELMGEEWDAGSFVRGSRAELAPIHSAWGNPNRFDGGTVTVSADEQWRTEMAARRRLASSALAGPVGRRYGYPLWARA